MLLYHCAHADLKGSRVGYISFVYLTRPERVRERERQRLSYLHASLSVVVPLRVSMPEIF